VTVGKTHATELGNDGWGLAESHTCKQHFVFQRTQIEKTKTWLVY